MINTRPFCYLGFLFHQDEDYAFTDFETGCTEALKTQPLQLASVMIDGRKLEVIKDSLFCSLIKPLSDEEAIKSGLNPISKQALDKNKLDLEELAKAPDVKTVWENFTRYIYKYNVKKDTWNAPILAGFNVDKFDSIIIDRLCKKYDPWDKKKEQQKLFNPTQTFDLKNYTFAINENNPAVERNSFDAVRDWLGLSKEGAHRADVDVLQGAEIMCKILKFIRYWAKKTDFGSGK